ncbi:centromere protein V-like isoform X4 [Scylla paramamosain]|uniref:centromere protein V-like isoform X4 n=1 Tax=Scylla paramamosain TaxID=85552 RepID=UPI003082A1D0
MFACVTSEAVNASPNLRVSQGSVLQTVKGRGCGLTSLSRWISTDYIHHTEVHAGRPGGLVRHTGGCHCGLVRFQVMAPPVLKVVDCNCSICVKKQNKHFIVPLNQFKLVSGHDALTTYTFNTHSAKHSFCSTCGVQPFHIPSDNPNAFGITPHSLDEGTVKKIQFTKQNAKKSEKVQGRRRSKR